MNQEIARSHNLESEFPVAATQYRANPVGDAPPFDEMSCKRSFVRRRLSGDPVHTADEKNQNRQ
jgi:hypothetical protein